MVKVNYRHTIGPVGKSNSCTAVFDARVLGRGRRVVGRAELGQRRSKWSITLELLVEIKLNAVKLLYKNKQSSSKSACSYNLINFSKIFPSFVYKVFNICQMIASY